MQPFELSPWTWSEYLNKLYPITLVTWEKETVQVAKRCILGSKLL